MKRIIRLICAFLISFSLLPVFGTDIQAAADPYRSEEIWQVNAGINQAIMAWKESYSFQVSFTNADIPDGLYGYQYIHKMYYDHIFDETENMRSGDYLRSHFRDTMRMDEELLNWDDKEERYTYKVTVSTKYATTAAQENTVDKEVKKVLDSLNVYTASDYRKIKAVYDWIADNVKYYDDNGGISGTVYGALVNRKAVCQGYAGLFYRMMRELGVECRLITGDANNGRSTAGHAWNIVRLGNKFYNIDTTWAAGAGKSRYFLKGSSNFKDHMPYDQWKEASFTSAYPISSSDYKATAADTANTVHVRSISLDQTSVKIKPGTSVKLNASVSPANAADKTLRWVSDNTSVATVDSTGKVTAKSEGFAIVSAVAANGYIKASCRVTVENIPLTGLKINKTELILSSGASEKLALTFTPSNATDKTVTWTSSDANIAYVSPEGLVIAGNTGKAIITAKARDGGYTVSCNVTVPDLSNPKAAVMYRLYNKNSGEHFYTAKPGERNALIGFGWMYEGVGWYAPKESETPVYRLYNSYAGDHHYTMKAAERDALVKAGWKYENIGWYSDDNEEIPLYRQYNPYAVSGSHNYTMNKKENDALVKIGWKEEGVGWYGVKN